MGRIKQISDNEFFAILRENGGLFARTARAIKKQFNIEYSRQAVRERSLKNEEIYNDILEENIDIAEEGIHSLMRSKNENVKFRACELYLKTIGKSRGYIERIDHDITTKGKSLNITDERAKEISDNLDAEL